MAGLFLLILEDAIYQILKNDAGVIALASSRIFAGVLPQRLVGSNDFPAIAYRPAAGFRPVRSLDGGIALVQERVHVFSACRGEGKNPFLLASETDRAVLAALDEFAGDVSDPAASPAASITIQGIFATSLSHQYGYEDATQTHQFVSEFDVHYLDPARL